MRIFITGIFILAGILSACNSGQKSVVKNHELQTNKFVLERLVFVSREQAFYACDSAMLLQQAYQRYYAHKMQELDQYIQQLEANLAQTKAQIDSVKSPAMLQFFNQAVAGITHRQQKVKAIKSIYQNHPELTQLGVWMNQINFYHKQDSVLLGYTQKAMLSGMQGAIRVDSVQRLYLWSPDKKRILGELTPPKTGP